MKNSLKLTLVTFITLFLFACDSSTTSKKTSTTTKIPKFNVDVSVTGSLAGTLNLINAGTNDSLIFNTIGTKLMTTDLLDNDNYNIQVATTGQAIGLTYTVATGNNVIQSNDATVVVNCLSGGSGNGESKVGKIYYESECAVCHSAGSDDTTNAFGANTRMELAKRYKSRVQQRVNGQTVPERVIADMHSEGGSQYNLMGRFDIVPVESIDHLRAYLAQVQTP